MIQHISTALIGFFNCFFPLPFHQGAEYIFNSPKSDKIKRLWVSQIHLGNLMPEKALETRSRFNYITTRFSFMVFFLTPCSFDPVNCKCLFLLFLVSYVMAISANSAVNMLSNSNLEYCKDLLFWSSSLPTSNLFLLPFTPLLGLFVLLITSILFFLFVSPSPSCSF